MNLVQVVFGATGQLTWQQECARAVVVFFFGLLLVRVAGRRVFGKWGAVDIIVSIMVGSNLSRVITGSAALFGTLLATTVIMILHWLLSYGIARSSRLSGLFEGNPIALAEFGSAKKSVLHRNLVSRADLEEALRQVNVGHVSETQLIMLEPSGKITVLKK